LDPCYDLADVKQSTNKQIMSNRYLTFGEMECIFSYINFLSLVTNIDSISPKRNLIFYLFICA